MCTVSTKPPPPGWWRAQIHRRGQGDLCHLLWLLTGASPGLTALWGLSPSFSRVLNSTEIFSNNFVTDKSLSSASHIAPGHPRTQATAPQGPSSFWPRAPCGTCRQLAGFRKSLLARLTAARAEQAAGLGATSCPWLCPSSKHQSPEQEEEASQVLTQRVGTSRASAPGLSDPRVARGSAG